MQVLGIRTSSKCVRYAILEKNDQDTTFVNTDSENKLNFPKDCDTIENKIIWFYDELIRIFRDFPHITKVVIKANQFLGKDNSTSRYSTNLDAIVMLAAKQQNKQLKSVIYASIQKGMNSKKIKSYAENNIGKTNINWDNQMADATAAAWVGITK
ncbi:hypothetical protein [Maridesulfovibrio sp.]|uniref:hypothetical protein n=1 Tax=Maridesulfovibrio sp. TaxID=2795000 RepID=UPI0029CA985E|nr:hypothetical protein [Maridesulfovibrio sp.]